MIHEIVWENLSREGIFTLKLIFSLKKAMKILKIYGFVPIWGLWFEKKPSEGPKNKNDPIFDIFRAFLSENISV